MQFRTAAGAIDYTQIRSASFFDSRAANRRSPLDGAPRPASGGLFTRTVAQQPAEAVRADPKFAEALRRTSVEIDKLIEALKHTPTHAVDIVTAQRILGGLHAVMRPMVERGADPIEIFKARAAHAVGAMNSLDPLMALRTGLSRDELSGLPGSFVAFIECLMDEVTERQHQVPLHFLLPGLDPDEPSSDYERTAAVRELDEKLACGAVDMAVAERAVLEFMHPSTLRAVASNPAQPYHSLAEACNVTDIARLHVLEQCKEKCEDFVEIAKAFPQRDFFVGLRLGNPSASSVEYIVTAAEHLREYQHLRAELPMVPDGPGDRELHEWRGAFAKAVETAVTARILREDVPKDSAFSFYAALELFGLGWPLVAANTEFKTARLEDPLKACQLLSEVTDPEWQVKGDFWDEQVRSERWNILGTLMQAPIPEKLRNHFWEQRLWNAAMANRWAGAHRLVEHLPPGALSRESAGSLLDLCLAKQQEKTEVHAAFCAALMETGVFGNETSQAAQKCVDAFSRTAAGSAVLQRFPSEWYEQHGIAPPVMFDEPDVDPASPSYSPDDID